MRKLQPDLVWHSFFFNIFPFVQREMSKMEKLVMIFKMILGSDN